MIHGNGPTLGTSGGNPDRNAVLAERFVGLADTLVDDFDVVELMETLVATCGEVLETSAAGLLLNDLRGALHVVASSSDETRVLELMQLQNAEGPCLDSVRQGTAVTSENLSQDRDRWPLFVPAALEAGYRSVHAMPLRLRNETIGSLNLFRSSPPALTAEEQRVAQALADVATIGILQERAIRRSEVVNEQLQSALNNRVTIEQAKGVLAQYGGLSPAEAFERLRRFARSRNLKISDVARRIVEKEFDLAEVLAPGDVQSRKPR